MSATPEYQVGDRVFIHRGGRANRVMGTVVKVARVYVDVLQDGRTAPEKYRIEDGRQSARYSTPFILSEAEQVRRDHEADVYTRLRDAGMEVRFGRRLPLDVVEQVVAVLEAANTQRQ